MNVLLQIVDYSNELPYEERNIVPGTSRNVNILTQKNINNTGAIENNNLLSNTDEIPCIKRFIIRLIVHLILRLSNK